jgi:hypothetical protein
MTEGVQERVIPQRFVVYPSFTHQISVPNPPGIPLEEGLHLQISGQQDASEDPRQVLGRYLFSLAAAKVIAESGIITDQAWANTRLEQGQKVSVYGKAPEVASSWRKPVDTSNRNVEPIQELNTYNQLQRLLGMYIPRWETLAGLIHLFPEGVRGFDSDSGFIVWRNPDFTAEVVKSRHLQGIHVVVHPEEKFERQWQTVHESRKDVYEQRVVQTYIQKTLEATAIVMGIQALIAPGIGEIHNSGNWARGLRSLEEGGTFNPTAFKEDPKREKRLHRPDLALPELSFGTSVHVHWYAPENPHDLVLLPPFSREEAEERHAVEVIKQWDAIRETTEEELMEIRQKLTSGRLTQWLKEHVQGMLTV